MEFYEEYYEKTCAYCEEAFTATRLNQDYCSEQCRMRQNNAVAREKRNVTQTVNNKLWEARFIYGRLFALNAPSMKEYPEVAKALQKIDEVRQNLSDDELQYATHIIKNADGHELVFCYDFGYMLNEDGSIVYLRKEKGVIEYRTSLGIG